MLDEPSDHDVTFRLGTVPISVSPWFVLVVAMLSMSRTDRPAEMAVHAAVMVLSVLAHELGHAVAMRRVGGGASIHLWAFGGLTRWNDGPIPSWKDSIAVSLAGPAASMAIAVFAFAAERIIRDHRAGSLVHHAILYAAGVNSFWTVVNLLPILPLDGGQVANALALRFAPKVRDLLVEGISVLVGIAAVILMVQRHAVISSILIGGLVAVSTKRLQAAIEASRANRSPLARARHLLLQRNVAAARALVDERLRRRSNDAAAQLLLACADLEEGLTADALRRAEQSAPMDPWAFATFAAYARGIAAGEAPVESYVRALDATGRPDARGHAVLGDQIYDPNAGQAELQRMVGPIPGAYAALAFASKPADLRERAVLALDAEPSAALRVALFNKSIVGREQLVPIVGRNAYVAFLHAFDPSEPERAFSTAELDALDEALALDGWDDGVSSLYHEAKALFLDASVPFASDLAFRASVSTAAFPLHLFLSRMRATVATDDVGRRNHVASVVAKLARRLAMAGTVLHRTMATVLFREVASARGDEAGRDSAERDRFALADLRERAKKVGRWPLPTLRDAVIDAMVEDEMAYLQAVAGAPTDG